MPAFFEPHFWDVSNAEFWVGAGLVLFLAIVVFVGAPKAIAAALDAKAAKIQADLDEAARLREEAAALLADLKTQRVAAEAQAKEVLAAAKADAKRMADEARLKLEEQIARRQQLAERKIALAESQATAEVKAAAAELAVRAAEQILAERAQGRATDPSIDQAVKQLAAKLG